LKKLGMSAGGPVVGGKKPPRSYFGGGAPKN